MRNLKQSSSVVETLRQAGRQRVRRSGGVGDRVVGPQSPKELAGVQLPGLHLPAERPPRGYESELGPADGGCEFPLQTCGLIPNCNRFELANGEALGKVSSKKENLWLYSHSTLPNRHPAVHGCAWAASSFFPVATSQPSERKLRRIAA